MATVTSGWAVNGPAKTQVEDARRLSYTLSGDAHGVATLDDLRVIPMDPPGPGVQVTRGSALIKSRYDDGETYLGSHNQTVTYATTQTPSSQGRSDLVVMRVEDPWARNSPWPEPAEGEADETEFFPIRIIEGVAPTTRARFLSQVPGYETETGIVLYRVDQPANNATVQEAMLVDLRTLANPRRHDVKRAVALVAGEGGKLTAAAGTFVDFPSPARVCRHDIYVPEWAEVMQIEANWYGLKGGPGKVWGASRVRIHPAGLSTQTFGYETPNTTDHKALAMAVADTLSIPVAIRGTVQSFFLNANVANSQGTDPRPYADEWSSVVLTVTFYEDRSQITS